MEHSSKHHHHTGAHHHSASHRYGRAFALASILNIGFIVLECVVGVLVHSTALMADAGHNLSDVLGLLLAWGASLLSGRRTDGLYTYGLRSSSILAALANSVLLLVACGAIAWEAVRHFSEPPVVAGLTVSLVAAAGVAINLISARLFMLDDRHDLNMRAVFAHMMADAALSLAVVIGGLIIWQTGWYWLDPLLSLGLVAVILVATQDLLRDSIRLALGAVPAHIDLQQVRRFLLNSPGVAEVYDLHIWGMSTSENALTAHLIMPDGHPGDAAMKRIAQQLEQQFAIHHSTLQIQQAVAPGSCALDSEH